MRSIFTSIFNWIALQRFGDRLTVSVSTTSRFKAWQVRPASDNHLTIGANSLLSCRISFDRAGANVRIGDRTYIGDSHLVAADSLVIGDDVLISWGVTIVDHNSHALDWDQRASDVLDWANGHKNWDHVETRPVKIENKAWIGFNAIILKGIVIGEEAIVAAGSVVTKDVPPHAIVAGNPARIVRMLNEHDR